MAHLVNCTPHAVRIVLPSGRHLILPPAPRPARLLTPPPRRTALNLGDEAVEVLASPPAPRTDGLPAPCSGTYYLVSGLVAAAHAGRPDLLAPATGPGDGALRDGEGRIAAVTRLRRYTAADKAAPAASRPRSAIPSAWLRALRRRLASALA